MDLVVKNVVNLASLQEFDLTGSKKSRDTQDALDAMDMLDTRDS